MTIEYLFDYVWIVWAGTGTLVQWWVTHKALRDLEWVRTSALNGRDERDAREALHMQIVFLAIQAVMVSTGIWRLSMEPDESMYYRWNPPNKLMVGSITVVIVSSLLMYASWLNLRLRKIQARESWMRQTGQTQTRKDDECAPKSKTRVPVDREGNM